MARKYKEPRTRALSASQAADCENAGSDVGQCRCRCKGQAHGINRRRAADGDPLRANTWDLPSNDPHKSRPPTRQSDELIQSLRRAAEEAAR